MKKNLLSIPIILGVLSTLMVGCKSSNKPSEGTSQDESSVNSETGPVTNIDVEGVSIEGNGNSVVKGQSTTLIAKISPINATNQEVEWSSDDESVATIDQSGRLTGVEFGRTVIRVKTKDGGFTSTYKVVVTKEGTKVVGVEELIEDMLDSDYAVNETGLDVYGLSDPTIVGASKDAASTVLFDVPADSEFEGATLINVADITLEQAKTYFASASELTDNIRIRTAIRLAKAQNDQGKVAKINFPENGHLYLDAADLEYASGSAIACILIDGLNGTYINGNHCLLEIKMANISASGYFFIKNCQNVYMNGFKLTQDVPTSLTGVVKSYDLDLKKITFDVVPEFNEVAKRHKASGGTVKGYLEFHDTTEAPLQSGNFFAGTGTCSGTPVITGDDQNGYEITLTFTTRINEPAIGTYGTIYYSQYDAYGMRTVDSKNMYFDDITMHYASGMGFVGENDENFYVNRLNIVRKEGSKAMVTSTADGTHFSMMKGIVKLTNSVIEYTGDDALNIKHGYYYRVSSRTSSFNRTVSLQNITSLMPEPKQGDKIAIYNEDTFEGHNPDAGYYTVDECTNSNGTYTIKFKEKLVGSEEEWGNCRATFISDTPEFEFSNNIVRNKRNRGILVQVPHPIIANNTFNHVGHGSIMVHSSMDIYNEATIPQEPTIINNKIMNGCYLPNGALSGDTSLFVISKSGMIAPKGTLHGLTYSNNFVANNGSAAISLRGTGDNLVSDNLFVNIGVLENLTETVKGVVSLNNSGTTTVKNNYNYNVRSQNLNGIVCRGLSGTDDVTLENNFNLEWEKADGEVGPEVHVAKSNTTFTIDGDIAEWENSNAHNVVFDGYSYADNTRTSKDAVKDHFEIKTFKLTHDDNGIYYAFDVYDNLSEIKHESEFWYGDCVEILATNIIDKPSSDLAVYCKDTSGDTIQLAFTKTWQSTVANVRSSQNAIDNKADLSVKVVGTENGYKGEVFLPFTMVPSWKTTIENGQQIDMAIVVADSGRKDEGLTRLQVGNVPHFVENFKTKTQSMPQYFFDK